MIIQQKIGQLHFFEQNDRQIDFIYLEWYEARKKILRKLTAGGKEISLKFLDESAVHSDGDVLFADDISIIAVSILPCDCIVIQPATLFEIASVCYDIGNKHLPLFYDAEELLVPFEKPLHTLLKAQGYKVKQQNRKLLHLLKTSVSPHAGRNDSLFSKIMKLTTS